MTPPFCVQYNNCKPKKYYTYSEISFEDIYLLFLHLQRFHTIIAAQKYYAYCAPIYKIAHYCFDCLYLQPFHSITTARKNTTRTVSSD